MDDEAHGPHPLGEYRGRVYRLTVKPPPGKYYSSTEDYEEIEGTVMLKIDYEDEEGNTGKVVRIDNSHGKMHVHKFYSEENGEETISMTYREAYQELTENWLHYAKTHHRKQKQSNSR